MSKLLREATALPHTTDLAKFEVQLKRRLARTSHRMYGRRFEGAVPGYSRQEQLPLAYISALDKYGIASRGLLHALADVGITKKTSTAESIQGIGLITEALRQSNGFFL